MKINGYILANRTQEVTIPTPGEEVEATITPNGSIRYDFYMFKNENVDRGTVYPAGGADLSASRTWQRYGDQQSGEYWSKQGEDCVPCNVSGNGGNDYTTFSPSSEVLWNGRHYVYDYMDYYTPNGSIIVSGLQPGKYVFELTHWIGYDDKTSETSVVRVDGNQSRIIKVGTHGVIEGAVFPDATLYTGYNDSYKGYVVKARLRYAFTVSEGDLSKTFEFGSGKDISFADLWDCVYMQELLNGQPYTSVWANAHVSFNAKVYTAL